MRCFADCNIPHPLDLLRLGGSSNWKLLNEKMLEYIDDQELIRLVQERKDEPLVDVDLDRYL